MEESAGPDTYHTKRIKKLSNPKWNEIYHDHRVIFWDGTYVNLQFKPSTAHLEALTYSSYYGQNCCKGGVGMHCCGFIIAEELWTAVSDTQYQIESGLLQRQETHQ